jgi:hypothetical protein
MSNPLAVPTVTAALTALVQAAVDTVGLNPGPRASIGTLEDVGDHNRVTVHLYRVSRNAAIANEDLPVRSSGGNLRTKPTVALDLHYLLCFRGDSELNAQTMMGATAVAIETNPAVSPELIQSAETDHAELADNDLREARTIRLCADTLSVDELTRLWALYPVGTYGLTLAVVAGPVEVEAAVVPATGIPVSAIALGTAPLVPLRLDSVGAAGAPGAPVRAAAPMPDVELFGTGLAARAGETVDVLVDSVPVAPTGGDDTRLIVPGTALMPGSRRFQVRRTGPPIDATLSSTRTSHVSEPRLLNVLPTLGAVVKNGTVLDAPLIPRVSRANRVRLLLDSASGNGSFAVDAQGLPAAPTGTVHFDVADVPAGTYRLTLEVDGARSLAPLDATGRYVQPEVIL